MNAHGKRKPARERRRSMQDIIEYVEDFAPRINRRMAQEEFMLIEEQARIDDEVWQSLAYVVGRQLWNHLINGKPVSNWALGVAARLLMGLGTQGSIAEHFKGVPFIDRPRRRQGRRRGPREDLRDAAMTMLYLDIVGTGKTKQYARDIVCREFGIQETAVKQAIRRCRKLIEKE